MKNNLDNWIFIISITLHIIFMPYSLCMNTSILDKFPLYHNLLDKKNFILEVKY